MSRSCPTRHEGCSGVWLSLGGRMQPKRDGPRCWPASLHTLAEHHYGRAQAAVTTPAGVAARYESLERNEERKEGVYLKCKKENRRKLFVCFCNISALWKKDRVFRVANSNGAKLLLLCSTRHWILTLASVSMLIPIFADQCMYKCLVYKCTNITLLGRTPCFKKIHPNNNLLQHKFYFLKF